MFRIVGKLVGYEVFECKNGQYSVQLFVSRSASSKSCRSSGECFNTLVYFCDTIPEWVINGLGKESVFVCNRSEKGSMFVVAVDGRLTVE